jgi:hypothetical protein
MGGDTMCNHEDYPCCGCDPVSLDPPEDDFEPEPSDPWLDCECDNDGEIIADGEDDECMDCEDDGQPSEWQEWQDFGHDDDFQAWSEPMDDGGF